ncbi:MAG: hypothetical protein H6867_01890 [Rhodospirillales bacterium]|nr:hypothetical protein [Rhodospirillales bacterium]MCB9997269.1 hypothetical protein [Rhodospirillales bacterium]
MEKIDKNKVITVGYKYHPQSGCTFILGFIPAHSESQGRRKKPVYVKDSYLIAWVPAGARSITAYREFDSYHSAYIYFMRMRNGDPPPELPYIRDYQQSRVYDWQWQAVKNYHSRLSLKAANEMIESICADYDLRAPVLDFRKDKYEGYCFYETERHEIGGHKRLLNRGNLIHECAHFIDTHGDQNIFQTHGPSFVKNFITLAATYIPGNTEKKLMKSAREAGLLGLPEEIHYVKPPRNPMSSGRAR